MTLDPHIPCNQLTHMLVNTSQFQATDRPDTMIARRSTLLLALAVAAPAAALILPDTCKEESYVPTEGGAITFW